MAAQAGLGLWRCMAAQEFSAGPTFFMQNCFKAKQCHTIIIILV
jgi:hypothetical protein